MVALTVCFENASAIWDIIVAKKSYLFGIQIDAFRMQDAVRQLRSWVTESRLESGCRFVLTPNVDHTVLLSENRDFRSAYEAAHLVLADGHPIVWASRLLGQPLPERVAGSELVPRFFDSCEDAGKVRAGKVRVFLLGAAEGVAARAAAKMKEQWPNVETVGVYSPPLGFEKSDDETNYALGRIALTRPDVVVVGLGAPKQELWVHQNAQQINAKVALCVGATIDFLAGEKKRAPVWMQRSGFEWLHRMLSEPKRLAKRYARDAVIFPRLVMKQMFSQFG